MKRVTLADHGERKKEKAALPNRSDRRQAGRRSHPRRALSTRDRGGGSPTRPPSPLFHPRGLAAPARRATRAPSVRRAPQPLPGLAFPERYRLEMRAPATATWKTQGFSPFPTLRAEFGTHAGLGADSRRASAAPTPQSAGAWDRGLCTERAAASAQAGRAPAGQTRGQLSGSPRGTWELENGRPHEKKPHSRPAAPTPCCPKRAGHGARRGESRTRLTVIAALHQPLSVGFSSPSEVQIIPAPMQTFAPSFQTLLQSNFGAIGAS